MAAGVMHGKAIGHRRQQHRSHRPGRSALREAGLIAHQHDHAEQADAQSHDLRPADRRAEQRRPQHRRPQRGGGIQYGLEARAQVQRAHGEQGERQRGVGHPDDQQRPEFVAKLGARRGGSQHRQQHQRGNAHAQRDERQRPELGHGDAQKEKRSAPDGGEHKQFDERHGCDTDDAQRWSSCSGGAFEIEQRLLARQAGSVAGQAAVMADDAVAGHDDEQRVAPHCRTHGARMAGGQAQPLREQRIADRLSVGYGLQRPPDRLLERRALGPQGQIEGDGVAAEIGLKLLAGALQQRCVVGGWGLCVVEKTQGSEPVFLGGELQRAQRAVHDQDGFHGVSPSVARRHRCTAA